MYFKNKYINAKKKNEVHVYIKYNHSLAVQIYEISNK